MLLYLLLCFACGNALPRVPRHYETQFVCADPTQCFGAGGVPVAAGSKVPCYRCKETDPSNGRFHDDDGAPNPVRGDLNLNPSVRAEEGQAFGAGVGFFAKEADDLRQPPLVGVRYNCSPNKTHRTARRITRAT